MSVRDRVEAQTEAVIFASRWLLAPIYVGLAGGLAIVLVKFFQAFVSLLQRVWSDTADDVVLGVLGLLDLALLSNLILIVIFAGYENFVSKIGVAEGAEDRPHWMGHVDFSGLKIKLIGSLVAISVIELLQDFVHARTGDTFQRYIADGELWRVVLHLTFVLSGVLFAVMDLLGDKRNNMNDRHALEMHARLRTDKAASEALEEARGS